ncbi:MAG: hypothetical protein AAGC47_12890 [Bacteroidota bacterium]
MKFLLSCAFAVCLFAPLSAQYRLDEILDFNESSEEQEYARTEFLISVRLFEFNSEYIDPWIDGITHLRTFGVDFTKPKGSDGLYKYVDEKRLNDFIDFSKSKNLKIIWTLNVSSFTLEQEMTYIASAIEKGLNITGFQYGGEFFLPKYARGDKKSKGVVERIRMDEGYDDYNKLLDMWIPAMTEAYPLDDYEHIIVAASVSNESGKAEEYRSKFNQKVFQYVLDRPDLRGKVSFSYHLYAGKMKFTNAGEEVIRLPQNIDWDFIADIPAGSRWVVTESGYYMDEPSKPRLDQARAFYQSQSEWLGPNALMGIHTLVKERSKFHPMPLYNQNGMTEIGENFLKWWQNGALVQETELPEDKPAEQETHPEENESTNVSSTNNTNQNSTPVLVDITPSYTGGLQWVHFSHTLKFSNGKNYKRNYWFSSPDFSKADVGKPISYFKNVLKSK